MSGISNATSDALRCTDSGTPGAAIGFPHADVADVPPWFTSTRIRIAAPTTATATAINSVLDFNFTTGKRYSGNRRRPRPTTGRGRGCLSGSYDLVGSSRTSIT
jgi:hypothetical protein